MLRVVHVIARMNVGGPAVEITELMRGLDTAEFEQELIVGHCHQGEADFLETQALDIPATRMKGLGRQLSPFKDVVVLAKLIWHFRRTKPDIVHTHTAKAGVLGRLAARLAGVDVVVIHTHHGHLLSGYFRPWAVRLICLVERALTHMTDRVITVGEHVRDELLEAGIGRQDQYAVIRSGVTLRTHTDREHARTKFGLPSDALIVSTIGRLTRIKRPDRLAEVAQLSEEMDLGAHFLVAGGGDEAEWLASTVGLRGLPMTLLGWRNDVEDILAASDIVLLTSDNEGTPLSLVQAGLAGLPVVATDVGSVSEVVEHGRTGLLCPPTSEAITQNLAILLADPDLRSRFGSLAKIKCTDEYSVDGFLQAHASTYEEAARLRRPRRGPHA